MFREREGKRDLKLCPRYVERERERERERECEKVNEDCTQYVQRHRE